MSVSRHMQSLFKFCPFVQKILNRNEIQTSIKGHNCVLVWQKMTSNNPNLDFVNIIAYVNFGEILSICSQDIEQTLKSDSKQGP